MVFQLYLMVHQALFDDCQNFFLQRRWKLLLAHLRKMPFENKVGYERGRCFFILDDFIQRSWNSFQFSRTSCKCNVPVSKQAINHFVGEYLLKQFPSCGSKAVWLAFSFKNVLKSFA